MDALRRTGNGVAMSEQPPPAVPEPIPEPAEPGHHLDPPLSGGGTPRQGDAVDSAEAIDEPEPQELLETTIGRDVL
jgi:hypothetical protein